MKSILVVCDYQPHILEYMKPAIDEARRRGYAIFGAYFGGPSRNMMRELGITDVKMYRAIWDQVCKPPTLSIPQVQSEEIFGWAKPSAVFIDLAGVGHAGGPWLVESRKRNITALEFGGSRARVYLFSKKTGKVTDRYIEQLKKVGYGQHSDGLLAATDVWQWVGLLIGDELQNKVDKKDIRHTLGFAPNQKYVVMMGNWGAGWGYANMTTADLVEWNAMAKQHGMKLVYSPHPVNWYADLAPHKIPDDVMLVGSFPGASYKGRRAKIIGTFDLVRGAEFVIFQYLSAVQILALAAQVPIWLRRRSTGRADPHKFSRQPKEEGTVDKIQAFPRWPYIERYATIADRNVRAECCYRTGTELEKLFRGELRFPGSVKDWARWDKEWRLRLDGKTAERIIDLLDNGYQDHP